MKPQSDCVLLFDLIILLLTCVQGENNISCDDIKSQSKLDIHEMAVTPWYGIVMLEPNPRNHNIDSCIIIEIKEKSFNNVELVWREKDIKITYQFVITDSNNRGNWTSQGSQTVEGPVPYNQFAGNIFIQKATYTNIILTFCSPPSQLYTLILSKGHRMNKSEVDTTIKMLGRFGVKGQLNVKEYCKNVGFILETKRMLILYLTIVFFKNIL